MKNITTERQQADNRIVSYSFGEMEISINGSGNEKSRSGVDTVKILIPIDESMEWHRQLLPKRNAVVDEYYSVEWANLMINSCGRARSAAEQE